MKTGWLLLGAAAVLYYANQTTPAGTTTGAMATLNTIDNYPSTLYAGLPTLDVILAIGGVFLLWKGHTL
jgi:hypothetical protein